MSNSSGILVFFSVILFLGAGVWVVQSIKSPSSNEGYSGPSSNYAQLGGGYNTQLFSPCVAKRCAGGPYMYTSNPYLQAVCQGVTNSELASVSCGRAFQGRPVRFDYSSLSNGAWDNALCNTSAGCGCSTSQCVL